MVGVAKPLRKARYRNRQPAPEQAAKSSARLAWGLPLVTPVLPIRTFNRSRLIRFDRAKFQSIEQQGNHASGVVRLGINSP